MGILEGAALIIKFWCSVVLAVLALTLGFAAMILIFKLFVVGLILAAAFFIKKDR